MIEYWAAYKLVRAILSWICQLRYTNPRTRRASVLPFGRIGVLLKGILCFEHFNTLLSITRELLRRGEVGPLPSVNLKIAALSSLQLLSQEI